MHRPKRVKRQERFSNSLPILLVADFLHPVRYNVILSFLNRDMSNRSSWCCSVPVLLARGDPDDIARMNLFHRTTFTLHPARS